MVSFCLDWKRCRVLARCQFRNSSTSFRGSGQAAGFMRSNGIRFSDRLEAITPWMQPMPFPFAETVSLTHTQHAQLEGLVRAGSTPQALAFRCQLILRAADKDQPSNLQIAAEFHCDRHTVGGWRIRYLARGLAGLQDAPRSGRPRSFSPLATARRDLPGQQHDRPTGLSGHPVGPR
jgi:hypothetical protein